MAFLIEFESPDDMKEVHNLLKTKYLGKVFLFYFYFKFFISLDLLYWLFYTG